MQKSKANILLWNDKAWAFLKKKLQLWKAGVSGGDLEIYPSFAYMLKEADFREIPSSVKMCIISHVDKLKEHFEEHFVENFDHLPWMKDPFGKIPYELSISEKETPIDLHSESFQGPIST